MKAWHRILFCAALLLAVSGQIQEVQAASVSGRSSTVLEWYDDAGEDTALPVYQYLRLNVKDIGGDGLDFKGYGRLGDDLNNETDADSRLYYGYIEKRDALKGLDFRLGRQFIATTAGASIMDGLFLDYDGLGPLRLKLFGGGDVAYYEGYNAKDLIAGAEISGRFGESLDLALSYVQRWEGAALENELFGFDLDYDWREVLNIYSETQFDYLSNSVSYFLGGLNYHRSEKWSLRGEYLYSLPVFSSTSIYSVFAVNEYEELMGELSYRVGPGLRTFARYSREMYEEFSDANVYEAGIEKIRTGDRFSGYLSGVFREDPDGQDLKGFKVRASYMMTARLQAGVGLELDTLERRLDTFGEFGGDSNETTSSRVWVDGTAYLGKKTSIQAKVERVESDLWDEYYRGRVRLNINF